MFVSFNKNRTSPTFGWKHRTHRLITRKIIDKYNSLLPTSEKINQELLKYSCVEPDFSRKNITKFTHGHFADIDNLSHTPPDAYQLTVNYTKKAIEAHKIGYYGKRDDYLGYALHFLQDMLNPMHVVYKPLNKTNPKRIFHRRFEEFAINLQERVFNSVFIKHNESNEAFFEQTLPKFMRQTKNLYLKVEKKDYSSLDNIISLALENTYRATDLYLKKFISELIKIDRR